MSSILMWCSLNNSLSWKTKLCLRYSWPSNCFTNTSTVSLPYEWLVRYRTEYGFVTHSESYLKHTAFASSTSISKTSCLSLSYNSLITGFFLVTCHRLCHLIILNLKFYLTSLLRSTYVTTFLPSPTPFRSVFLYTSQVEKIKRP